MPLYRFCVSTPEGAAEMELGFHEDGAAIAYAHRFSGDAEVTVWRDHVRVGPRPSLHLQAEQACTALAWNPRKLVLSLLYVSVSLIPRSAADQEVEEIVRSAIDHNLRAGITGAIVLADGRFAQALEGPRGEVAALMGRIAIDPRHTSVRVVSTSFGSERRFPNWGMIQLRDTSQYADLTHMALTAAEAPLGAAKALHQLLAHNATARF